MGPGGRTLSGYSYAPEKLERFGGLSLQDDPGEVGWSGAIDCLNIDFDRRGRMRSRDGFAKFTAAAAAGAYHALAPFYTTSGTKQLIGAFSGAVNALSTAGAVVAAQVAAGSTYASVARFAAPGSEHAYVAVSGSGAATVYRWDGAAWTTPTWTTTTPTGRHLAVTAEGRLANARYNGSANGNSPSTVRFCDVTTGPPAAVVPTTWPANNFVEISPGDGEEIMALVTWGQLTFAFKQTKYAVFYGTSTDSSGSPIFNYRMVTSQGLAGGVGGSAYRAIAVAPHGVYFANRRGIWLTTGDAAQLVSRAVDPLFRGDVSTPGPSAINQGAIDQCAMVWHDERLWFAYPSGSATTNDRVLRFDPATNTWSMYDFPATALASFRIGNSEELVFTVSGGTITLQSPAGVSGSSDRTPSSLPFSYSPVGPTNTPWYYKVTALNAAGQTTPSAEVTVTPQSVVGDISGTTFNGSLAGSLNGAYYYGIAAYDSGGRVGRVTYAGGDNAFVNKSAKLDWTAATTGLGTIAGYFMWRNQTGTTGPWTHFRDIGNVLTFTDDGTVAFSTGSSPHAVTSGQITLTWGAVIGATSYRVYRGTTSGGENVYYAPGNVTSYIDTGAASTGGTPPVSNTATTAGFDVARHSSAYTADGGDGLTTGAAIASRYRSGFSDLGGKHITRQSDGKGRIRQWRLRGSGTVTFGVAADDAAAIPTTNGGAQASVVLTGPYPNYRTSQFASNFAWQVNATTAWRLDSLQADVG